MTKSSDKPQQQPQTQAQPELTRHLTLFLTTTYEHGVLYEPGYYFYDETGDLHGPFSSHKEANEAFNFYCVGALGDD